MEDRRARRKEVDENGRKWKTEKKEMEREERAPNNLATWKWRKAEGRDRPPIFRPSLSHLVGEES